MLKFVEHMLAELNAPAIDWTIYEDGFGRTVKKQPGGNACRIADKDICFKSQVGNVGKVFDQHVAIARQPGRPAFGTPGKCASVSAIDCGFAGAGMAGEKQDMAAKIVCDVCFGLGQASSG